MKAYQAAWLNVTVIVGAVGLLVALLGGGTLVNTVAAASIGLGAGTMTYMTQEARGEPRYRRQGLAVAAAVTAASLAITGLFALDGPATLLAVALLSITSPPAARAYRTICRRLGRRRRPTLPSATSPSEPAGRSAPSVSLTPRGGTGGRAARTLGDAQLYLAWPTSSVELDDARRRRDIPAQARLLALRQEYLDELERRHPEGFQLRLETSAHPASDPNAWLGGTAGQAPPPDDDPRRR